MQSGTDHCVSQKAKQNIYLHISLVNFLLTKLLEFNFKILSKIDKSHRHTALPKE